MVDDTYLKLLQVTLVVFMEAADWFHLLQGMLYWPDVNYKASDGLMCCSLDW